MRSRSLALVACDCGGVADFAPFPYPPACDACATTTVLDVVFDPDTCAAGIVVLILFILEPLAFVHRRVAFVNTRVQIPRNCARGSVGISHTRAFPIERACVVYADDDVRACVCMYGTLERSCSSTHNRRATRGRPCYASYTVARWAFDSPCTPRHVGPQPRARFFSDGDVRKYPHPHKPWGCPNLIVYIPIRPYTVFISPKSAQPITSSHPSHIEDREIVLGYGFALDQALFARTRDRSMDGLGRTCGGYFFLCVCAVVVWSIDQS